MTEEKTLKIVENKKENKFVIGVMLVDKLNYRGKRHLYWFYSLIIQPMIRSGFLIIITIVQCSTLKSISSRTKYKFKFLANYPYLTAQLRITRTSFSWRSKS